MFKAELKQRWGMYCDTDKLVSDMMVLLTKYHHDCTEHGVCEILNTYFENKKNLIDMLQKSEHYVGNMRICLDIEMERMGSHEEIINFCDNFPSDVDAKTVFLKYVDEHGKTLQDYIRIGIGSFKARELCYGNIFEQLFKNENAKNAFNSDGSTKKSYAEYLNFACVIANFNQNIGSELTEETISGITRYNIDTRLTKGMKTSRAFNRICSYYGVDKLPNYNRLFARYADMVSGLKRKMKFYISLNPLDYLTMSFGNSWSSCHTIDKTNQRDMPTGYSGMHCGGTMSYLLDKTSIITYVHNKATEDHEEGKIYRNMFHFSNGALIQGRVYPQSNDGATDLYKTFRRYMQIELTKLLGLDRDDWIKKSVSSYGNVVSRGVHYRDYEHFSSCNMSYPREMPNATTHIVEIGHERICPKCGAIVADCLDSGYLTHGDCDYIVSLSA